MSHLYENEPDARQSNVDKGSRFRPRYRKLEESEVKLHDEIKAKAAELETLFEQVPAGRYSSLAMTELELSVMWIVKQLTSSPE